MPIWKGQLWTFKGVKVSHLGLISVALPRCGPLVVKTNRWMGLCVCAERVAWGLHV